MTRLFPLQTAMFLAACLPVGCGGIPADPLPFINLLNRPADGEPGATGADGINGLNCWDLNEDREYQENEDVNGDGLWTVADCQGETGPAGEAGADGATGDVGPVGPPGADGSDGADGRDGLDGSDGEDGESITIIVIVKPNDMICVEKEGNTITVAPEAFRNHQDDGWSFCGVVER